MSIRTRKLTLAAPLAIGLAALAAGPLASSASASAVGIQPFNEGTVDTPWGSFDVPRGELDHGTTGKGLRVESDSAGLTSVSPVCNWEMIYEHSNLDGVVYRSQTSGLISDCDTNVNAPGVTWTGNAQPGKSCAVLRAGGATLARQCHNITAH